MKELKKGKFLFAVGGSLLNGLGVDCYSVLQDEDRYCLKAVGGVNKGKEVFITKDYYFERIEELDGTRSLSELERALRLF